jgi:hypothetical protein
LALPACPATGRAPWRPCWRYEPGEERLATFFDTPLPASPGGAVRAGIGRIPEDRHHEGIVGSLTVAENLIIETLTDPAVQRFGFLRFGAIRRRAQAAIAAFDVRCPGPDSRIRLLSGGNIQKVILARELGREPGSSLRTSRAVASMWARPPMSTAACSTRGGRARPWC